MLRARAGWRAARSHRVAGGAVRDVLGGGGSLLRQLAAGAVAEPAPDEARARAPTAAPVHRLVDLVRRVQLGDDEAQQAGDVGQAAGLVQRQESVLRQPAQSRLPCSLGPVRKQTLTHMSTPRHNQGKSGRRLSALERRANC